MKYDQLQIIVESLNVPKFLYHATFQPLIQSILKYGLGGSGSETKRYSDSQSGVVYLADSYDVAESYAEVAEDVPDEWLDQIVVFKIEVSKLDQLKLSKDKNVQDGDTTFEYSGIIPTSNLQLTSR